MPGNDFEKQVQQKMDELQFVPSDAVWPAVERQITEKKKRRVIIWLPFLVLLLGGTAWMYFSNNTHSVSKKQRENIVTTKTAGNNKDLHNSTKDAVTVDEENKKSEPVPLKNNSGKPAVAANWMPEDKEKSEKSKHTNLHQNSFGTIAVPEERIKIKRSAQADQIIDINDDETATALTASAGKRLKKQANNFNGLNAAGTKNTSKETVEKGTVIKDEVAGTKTTAASRQDDKAQANETTNNAVVSIPVIDSAAADALAITKQVSKDSIQKRTIADSGKAIATNKVSSKTKKNIEWGGQVSAGVSSISDGFSGIFSGGQSFDITSFSSVQQGRPSNSIPYNAAAIAPPSAVKSGFAFSAGVFLNKPFKKGLSIRTGINYHYYSTTMQIGSKIDTGVLAGYYRTGTANKYINQFHFIELPVTIQQSFGKKSRFSINAGVSLSVLAASNVLLYDASKISYTAQKSYLNKMQFNVLAGFSYRLFPQSLPLEIGPQFNLGISNIYNKEMYGSKHLFFAGLRAGVFFHKK